MSYSNGPRIISDGLVFCIDFANPKSYAGTGTVVGDLSGNRNNGTLVGFGSPPNFSTPYADFPGVTSSFISTPVPAPVGTEGQRRVTYEVWLRLGTSPTGWYGICTQHFNNYYAIKSDTLKAIVMLTSTTNGNVANNIWPETNTALPVGTTFCLTLVIVEDSTATYYINGRKDITHGPYGNLRYQGTTGQFFVGVGLNTMPFKGFMYSAKMYNRALSDSEVLQNYEATKGRFLA